MSQINSKNTKYELANALIELTKEGKPENISISSVAFRANMHRNTVYYHFNDMRDLCFWSIHNELKNAVVSPENARDGLAYFFTRFKPLLDYTKSEVGVDSFLSRMRIELLPILEPLVHSDFIDSEEKKLSAVEIFTQQILVAYLLQAKPANMIKLVFDDVMPSLLDHDFLFT